MNKQLQHHLRAVSVLAISCCIIIFHGISPALASPPSLTYPTDSAIFGRNYGDWVAAWNQWATSIPASVHPLFDKGDASTGQSGPVWFLGGKFCYNNATNCGAGVATRDVTVPAGKALFFPIYDAEDSFLEDPTNANLTTGGLINGLRTFSASNIDTLSDLSLTVDGVEVRDLITEFRVQSPAFSFTLPNDNIFAALYPPEAGPFPGGTYFPGVDDGIFVMLKPLKKGQHIIHFHAYQPPYQFTIDITYNINQL